MPNVPATSSSGSSPTARKPIDPTVSGVFYALGAFLMWGVLPLLFRALQPRAFQAWHDVCGITQAA
jgi:hypothetical protein